MSDQKTHKHETIPNKVKPLVQLISGAIAGSTAASVTCPIEVLKTRLQSSQVRMVHFQTTPGLAITTSSTTLFPTISYIRYVIRTEGFIAFYKGLVPSLVGVTPSKAIYFFVYEQSKYRLGGTTSDPGLLQSGSNCLHFISAVFAGLMSTTFTNPIWVLKTRLQISSEKVRRKGVTSMAEKILKEEGLRGFMRGLTASYVGISDTAMAFVFYERLKRRNAEMNGYDLTGKRELSFSRICNYVTSALISKSISAFLFYPHEVVRTRLREEAVGDRSKRKYRGFLQTFFRVLKEEGRRGLYGGLITHLVRVVPFAGATFLTFECTMAVFENFNY